MKKVLFFGVLSLMFLINACGPDEPKTTTTTLTLNFQGDYGDDDLVFFKYYDYQNGDSIFLNVAHFFVSEITLLKGSEEVKIKDIAVLDFANNHLRAAGDGESIAIEGVEAGEYTGIRFGIGVDSIQNHTIPADYEAGHPLANASEYWDWRETYIFGKFEGRLKTDSIVSYAYHPGTDELYRSPSFSKTFTLTAEVPQTLNFTVDFEKLFNQSTGKVDIANNNISHTGQADLWLATLIMDNLADAFEIE